MRVKVLLKESENREIEWEIIRSI